MYGGQHNRPMAQFGLDVGGDKYHKAVIQKVIPALPGSAKPTSYNQVR